MTYFSFNHETKRWTKITRAVYAILDVARAEDPSLGIRLKTKRGSQAVSDSGQKRKRTMSS